MPFQAFHRVLLLLKKNIKIMQPVMLAVIICLGLDLLGLQLQ